MNIYVLLKTILIMVSTTCNFTPNLSKSTYILSEIDGITMEVINVDNGSISYEITNNSEYSLIQGNSFAIEINKENIWYKLPLLRDNMEFTLEGYGLDPGGNSELTSYYSDLYGTLSPGNYRIIKDISVGNGEGNYRQYYLGAEFTIK